MLRLSVFVTFGLQASEHILYLQRQLALSQQARASNAPATNATALASAS
jgi:hypothetical protein